MRLTLEEVVLNNSNRKEFSHFSDFLNQEQKELIDYKTLEEELSIDLITLFKALKNGFYYEIEYEDEFEKGFFKLNNTSMQIDFDKKAFVIESQIFICFKDYGKTWSLTQEELL